MGDEGKGKIIDILASRAMWCASRAEIMPAIPLKKTERSTKIIDSSGFSIR
jgi:hypothetical protein